MMALTALHLRMSLPPGRVPPSFRSMAPPERRWRCTVAKDDKTVQVQDSRERTKVGTPEEVQEGQERRE